MSLVGMVKENKEEELQKQIVKDFIENFIKEYNREPTIDEIHNNLDDSMNMDLLNSLIKQNKKDTIKLENIIINND